MSQPSDTLKLIADSTRLRMIHLLQTQELSVAEIQEILEMGQSRISSHLSLLRQADLVSDRKDGKKTYYSLNRKIDSGSRSILEVSCQKALTEDERTSDLRQLNRILSTRQSKAAEYFNALAGKMGKNYCPGRSWEAISHFLVQLMPSLRIIDLGAGESLMAQLLASNAEHITCVDSSEKMVAFGQELAKKNGFSNIDYLCGDIEKVPLEDNLFDLAILSQALHHAENPSAALSEAYRLLRPGGKLILLDLKEHTFEKAHELYADRWLGFSPKYLHQLLEDCGFQSILIDTVAKETEAPNFETILASGVK